MTNDQDFISGVKEGRGAQTRTGDLRVPNAALYHLSHTPIGCIIPCAEDGFYFEPLSDLSSEYLIHFTRMMEDYTVAGEDNDHKK